MLSGGVLLALAMPSPRLTPLAPLGLALLYREVQKESRFSAGFSFGFTFFLLSLSWILFPVKVYGRVPFPLALIPLFLLSAYLALFFALPLWILRRFKGIKHIPPEFHPLLFAILVSSAEEVRGWLFTGFPWNPIALSLTRFPLLLKPAQAIGVTGLSFLLLWLSAILVHLYRFRSGKSLIQLLVVLFLWILASLPSPILSRRELTYAVIQGSIPQDVKWTREYQQLTLQVYEDLTRQALARKPNPDLILWPETAAPFYFQQPGPLHLWVRRIAQNARAPLLFGAPAYDEMNGQIREYNRAYLLGSEGEIVGFYDKIHLVPFGEYVPLGKLLSFVHRFAQGIGEFARGRDRSPLSTGEFAVGVLICYEAIFPYEVREFVSRGANLLVQITNDAWFGPTWAPEQHLELARLRAIELGVPLLRAANTGISAVVSSDGTLVERTSLFTRTLLAGTLAYEERYTLFRRIGGLYLWIFSLSFFLPLLFVVGERLGKFFRRHPSL